ncbi:mediator complex subunit [Puccinia graminis f. sp. tritici]|uniref:Mediator of RNA polymerase II transcription subunit 5 n=1 Tax=Puccinia graminis f. sp. tritici TaxID=56615 RepID=A0A5B0PWV5_PUCGR|nr:mediator complex subunit [Puccinia graminis f. sp. tritici]KAA1105366.1 mediator complex subunit [Puccinia graminis f. sp. tritici]
MYPQFNLIIKIPISILIPSGLTSPSPIDRTTFITHFFRRSIGFKTPTPTSDPHALKPRPEHNLYPRIYGQTDQTTRSLYDLSDSAFANLCSIKNFIKHTHHPYHPHQSLCSGLAVLLMSNLSYHLGATTGFTIHHLSNPSTSYPISSLPATHQSTLSSWIEALYGSSGIPDDLLGHTDPRIFFSISATLFKQSFDALTIGLIDLQTFRDGLSYFEHKLLVGGCAVGVVGWLLNELTRVGILLSDAITPTALHLVSARSLAVIRAFDASFSRAPPDHLGPGSDLNRRVQLDLGAIERRLSVLPASEMIEPAGFLAYDFGSATGWPDALDAAVRSAVRAETDSPDPTIALWSLLPHILKAVSVGEFVQMTIRAAISASKIDDEHDSEEAGTAQDSRPSLPKLWSKGNGFSSHEFQPADQEAAGDFLKTTATTQNPLSS